MPRVTSTTDKGVQGPTTQPADACDQGSTRNPTSYTGNAQPDLRWLAVDVCRVRPPAPVGSVPEQIKGYILDFLTGAGAEP